MNKIQRIALTLVCLYFAGQSGKLLAQGYTVNAQISSQAAGDGTYNYTILLQNSGSSSQSISQFWFAWVPYGGYGYDLMPSYPTVTGTPSGWYGYTDNQSYYYSDGYSIDFLNYYGSSLAPGQTDTFTFNSPDSPTTLGLDQPDGVTSPYYDTPMLTSYVYNDTGSDPGTQFVVAVAAVPEPSTLALLGLSAAGVMLRFRNKN